MTTKDYCYSIAVKAGKAVNKNTIVSHLESLFRNKKFGKDAFDVSEKVPIDFGVATLWKNKKSVCLDIKSRAKPVRTRIQRLLRAIKDTDLVVNTDVQMTKPIEKADVCDFERFKQAKGGV